MGNIIYKEKLTCKRFSAKKTQIILIVCFVLMGGFCPCLSQNRNIDSLKTLLNPSLPDSIRASALSSLVWEFKSLGKLDTAMEYAQREYDFSKKAGLKKGISGGLSDMGFILDEQGNHAKALEYFQNALKIDEETGNKKGIATRHLNIGLVFVNQGDFPGALERFFKSLQISEEINDKEGAGKAMGNIGGIYQYQRDFKKAEEYYNKSLALAKELNNWNELVRLYGNLGIVRRNTGDFAGALEYYKRALDLNIKHDHKDGIARTYGNMGSVFAYQGNCSEGIEYYSKALKINEELGNKTGCSIWLGNMGMCNAMLKKNKEAEKCFLRALALSTEARSLIWQKDHHRMLSEFYTETGRAAEALEHYKKYIRVRDTLFNEANTKKSVKAEMNFSFEKKEHAAKLEQEKKDAIALETLKRQKLKTLAFAGGGGLVLLLSLVVLRGYNQKKKANSIILKQKREVELQKDLVEEKQKEILDSINYARRIQGTLLAHHEFVNENVPNNFILFKPKDIVSGDFYWATKKDGRFYIAVCDSTGHGVPGAFMSLLNITFLNEAINEKNISEPHHILNHVRERLISNMSKDGGQDGMDGILICIENSGVVSYAAANNAPLLISNNALQELPCDKMPIGIGQKKESFTLHHVPAKKGDSLYLYTDGFADQFGGPKGKKFKYKPLQETILQMHHLPVSDQHDQLDRIFNEWKGTLEQVDDVLIMGIKI